MQWFVLCLCHFVLWSFHVLSRFHTRDENADAEANAETPTHALHIKHVAKSFQKILLCLHVHRLQQFGVWTAKKQSKQARSIRSNKKNKFDSRKHKPLRKKLKCFEIFSLNLLWSLKKTLSLKKYWGWQYRNTFENLYDKSNPFFKDRNKRNMV